MEHYRKVVLLWIVMVVGMASTATAKAPEIEWARVIGGKAGEVGNCIQRTYDGGYIIAGTKDERIWTGLKYLKGTGCLIYLIKLDNDGNVKWENTYGDTNSFYSGNFVEQTSDSGFVITGSLSLSDGSQHLISLLILQNTFYVNFEFYTHLLNFFSPKITYFQKVNGVNIGKVVKVR